VKRRPSIPKAGISGNVPLFSPDIDGKRIDLVGQIYRRERNGKWEYRQEKETDEDL